MRLIDAENIIAWLNAKIEKARRGGLPVDAIALYGDAIMFVKNLPKVKPKSNGDRIRQMTDEELADKLTDKCAVCAYHYAECETKFCLCMEGVLKWLKEACEDAGTG